MESLTDAKWLLATWQLQVAIGAGYTAYMAVDTETGVGVVLLRNYNQGETNLARAAQSLIQELAPVLR